MTRPPDRAARVIGKGTSPESRPRAPAPRGRRVGNQTRPVAAGQGVVGQRHHGVGDQRRPAGPAATPTTGRPGRRPAARCTSGPEHHQVLEDADRPEQHGRQQPEQRQGGAARRGHAQPGRSARSTTTTATWLDHPAEVLGSWAIAGKSWPSRLARPEDQDRDQGHRDHRDRPASRSRPGRRALVVRRRHRCTRPASGPGPSRPRRDGDQPAASRRRARPDRRARPGRSSPVGQRRRRQPSRTSSTRARRKARRRALPRVCSRRMSRSPAWRRRWTRRRDRHSRPGCGRRRRTTAIVCQASPGRPCNRRVTASPSMYSQASGTIHDQVAPAVAGEQGADPVLVGQPGGPLAGWPGAPARPVASTHGLAGAGPGRRAPRRPGRRRPGPATTGPGPRRTGRWWR